MIQKLKEENREECMALVKDKPAENLFIIGDIETYGFDSDFQDVWGEFDTHNRLKAILLKYRENYIVYAPSEFNAYGFAEIIDQDHGNKFVSGISSIVSKVVEQLKVKPNKSREFYYAKCEELSELDVPEADIKLATVRDVPRILELQSQIVEFESREGREEGVKKNVESGMARGYFIEEGDKVISSAMTTAENSLSAMVVGVCTLPGHEKRGYASAIMTRLCKDLLQEGKYLCLFYDNPAAGNIYKRLGFVDIGKWQMNTF